MCGVVMASGLVGVPMALALLLAVFLMWGGGFVVVVYLEAAEVQGDELELLVRRDPLTGAGNRRLLAERLDGEVGRHGRTGRPVSVLALDLNGFKALNDGSGHAAGDEVLRRVADALRGLVRAQDTVVRQGGDELCLLLPETDTAQARRVAGLVRDAVARTGEAGYPISTGVGAATFPVDAATGDALLHVADERLRADKRELRNAAAASDTG